MWGGLRRPFYGAWRRSLGQVTVTEPGDRQPADRAPRPGRTPSTPRRPGGRDRARARSLKPLFKRAVLESRGAVVIAVAVLLISAVAAFLCGCAVLVWSLLNVIQRPLETGRNVGLFLLMGDAFLVGMMMLVAAIGLYELFVRPLGVSRPRVPLPGWRTSGLSDMAARLIPMLSLIAVMSFAAVLAGVQSGHDLLLLGGGLALIIAALMAVLRFGKGGYGRS